MSIFDPEQITVQCQRRVNQIVIDLPAAGDASVSFGEEDIYQLPSGDFLQCQKPGISFSVVEGASTEYPIPMRDAILGFPTGESVSVGRFLQIAQSFYRNLAEMRERQSEPVGSVMPEPLPEMLPELADDGAED